MTITDFEQSLDYLFKAQLTAFVWGHAGTGKTSTIRRYAAKKGYYFFPLYLGTQSDTGDILGLQDFIRDASGTATATKFATPEWLRNAIDYCNNNPDSGAVIFLDEFNRGRKDIISAMFSLALDKTFHTLRLPKNCHIIAAGNPPTDEYFTTDINETALMARFVHIKLEPTFDEWAAYATKTFKNQDYVSFLKQQPELLAAQRSEFELPVKVDGRSWELLDRLATQGTPEHLMSQLMPGIVGLDRTVAYQAYMKTSDKPVLGLDVLNGIGFEKIAVWSNPTETVSSLLNATCQNVGEILIEMETQGIKLETQQKSNLMRFFHSVPKDIVYPLIQREVNNQSALFKNFYLDPLYERQMIDLIAKSKGK